MNIWNFIGNWFAKFFLIIFVIAVVFGAIKAFKDKQDKTTSPVENIIVDSLSRNNDILIIEVEHLDSIKDVKTIEVKSLDNDSTLKLFYKLISE